MDLKRLAQPHTFPSSNDYPKCKIFIRRRTALSVSSGTVYPDTEDASLNRPPRPALSILSAAGTAPLLDKFSTSKTKLSQT